MIIRRFSPSCILVACAASFFAALSIPAAAAFAPLPHAQQAASSTLRQWRTLTAADAIGGSGRCSGHVTSLLARNSGRDEIESGHFENNCHNEEGSRRNFLSQSASAAWSAALVSMIPTNNQAALADDSDSAVESIASRAARLSKNVEDEQKKALEEAEIASPTTTVGSPSGATASSGNADTRTMYDFDLPMKGFNTPMTDLLARPDKSSGEDGGKKQPKVVLFVNIKQDDVVARKNIPELIALASKFGREGDFAVVCSPTDQGYYEPDTSQLIRLKLAQEYGYGINPATIVTDKVNLLGTGAHPFWRWIQGTGRAPDGLGRIRGNFEKFLVVNGRPVRRYPRKYEPKDIQDDIEALLNDRPLPPAGSNWREQWRAAAKEAETDTYRFQKGLNVFDQ